MTQPSNPWLTIPPDWDQRQQELLCPLCKYNLRGLSMPRCPECGFAFSWNELIETIAFRQYLRVHLLFATVLASQVIALLVVFLVLLQIADFSRWV